jgi:hypothetical protein
MAKKVSDPANTATKAKQRMTGRSNLKSINMRTNQGKLISIKMRLGEDQDDAMVLAPKPEDQALQSDLITMGRRPGRDVGDDQDGAMSHERTGKTISSLSMLIYEDSLGSHDFHDKRRIYKCSETRWLHSDF